MSDSKLTLVEKRASKIRRDLSTLLREGNFDTFLIMLASYTEEASNNTTMQEVLDEIIREESDPSDTTLVELAIKANSLPIVKALVKLGVSLNVEIEGGKSMVDLAGDVAGKKSALYKFVSLKAKKGGRRSRKNRRSHKNRRSTRRH